MEKIIIVSREGSASLLSLSSCLVQSSKDERSSVAALMEREARRERLLGGIQKEERNRKMTQDLNILAKEEHDNSKTECVDKVKEAEEKFFKIIRMEKQARGVEIETLMGKEKV